MNATLAPTLQGPQKASGVQEVTFSTPSESLPVLGEKKRVYALVFAFILALVRMRPRPENASSNGENARLMRISLPKTGEGSGGVDVEERLFD